MARNENGRPCQGGPVSSTAIQDVPSLPPRTVTFADLDAWAEHYRGRFMVEVEVGSSGQRRTYYYANVRAAERAVNRARARGAESRVGLVQTIPVGVLTGLASTPKGGGWR